jgi:hypothetical protein
MKTSKIVTRAIELKAAGYTRMASIVKSTFASSYYHIVAIDDIIAAGKWIPAGYTQFESGAHGRLGTLGSHIDWSKTARK